MLRIRNEMKQADEESLCKFPDSQIPVQRTDPGNRPTRSKLGLGGPAGSLHDEA